MKHSSTLFLALLLTASAAIAQPIGTITDGDISFTYNDINALSGALVDQQIDVGTDHVFAQWWWYRLDGDTAETALPQPLAESYVGNVATLDFDLGGGLSAREVVLLADTGDASGLARHDLTIRNDSGATVSITVFHYQDYDLDGTILDDSAALLGPTNIGISDVSLANYRGLGADAYQVAAFSDIANLLGDDVVTDLDNSGLPFDPADFTGAWQWNAIEIPNGAAVTYSAVKTVDNAAAPLEVAFAGSCPGTVNVAIAGATPNGTVAVAGSDSLGSFTVPGGGCAGAQLGISSPSLLATPSANGSGQINVTLNLPQASCGQIVQLVDLTSCNVSNTDPIP